ncbi:hypothetical protein J4212_05505 [Candidatus Woesearchaeota archaeon]|nr:hypothetical protein [Candidatus Woesearchaeota archaeon]
MAKGLKMASEYEVENKIIDFVKKNPLGVTSSQIAKYLGINRITLTKYLAIIRQKAKLDFKQFGMAKLWYIPVDVTKEGFLLKVMSKSMTSMSPEQARALTESVGNSLGEEMFNAYKGFYNVQKLSIEHLEYAFLDIGSKLGGNFKTKSSFSRISLEALKDPFGNEAMLRILCAVFAKMAAANFGFARAMFYEAKEGKNAVLEVILVKEKQE